MQTLLREGFSKAYSMDGGIKAWEGLVATGSQEVGMAYFSPAASREDFILLSWNLEEGTRTFYERISGTIVDPRSTQVLQELVAAEKAHQNTLRELFTSTSKETFDPAEITPGQPGGIMEGGMDVASAIAWARERELVEILELSMSLEANAYDRYVLMSRNVEDDGSREVFTVLSREEKGHLDTLTTLFEDMIAK